MKNLLLLILLLFVGCSKTSNRIEKNRNHNLKTIEFPEQTNFTKSLLDSLKNVTEYKLPEYILYCRKGSYSEKHIDSLFTQIDMAVERIKDVMKIKNISRGFYLIMVDSRDEMKQLIGYRYKGMTYKDDDLTIFVHNKNIRPYFKHELFHLISNRVWGRSQSRVLDEGGAMYTDNNCLKYENPISTINKYLYENKMWFKIDELIHNFNQKARENDMIAYLEAAYIFRHLFENYGEDKLIELWQKGFSYFKNIYGFDILQLEKNIKKEIKKIELKKVDWTELMNKGCG